MDPDELPPQTHAIIEAPDHEARDLEKGLIELSDNGWVEGDPEDQPENPEQVRTDD